jgi:hypothetical protein
VLFHSVRVLWRVTLALRTSSQLSHSVKIWEFLEECNNLEKTNILVKRVTPNTETVSDVSQHGSHKRRRLDTLRRVHLIVRRQCDGGVVGSGRRRLQGLQTRPLLPDHPSPHLQQQEHQRPDDLVQFPIRHVERGEQTRSACLQFLIGVC